jgi:hypothetical protein
MQLRELQEDIEKFSRDNFSKVADDKKVRCTPTNIFYHPMITVKIASRKNMASFPKFAKKQLDLPR